MKRSAIFKTVLPLLALAACAPLGTYYKEGVTQSRLNKDLTNCEVSAAQQVPPNKQIRSTPIYVTPVTTTCEAGKCTSIGGYVRGGHVYSVDTNKALRGRVKAQCMSSKGYQYVDLPRCTSEQLQGRNVKVVTRLPRLTNTVCATSLPGGGSGIVDLSKL